MITVELITTTGCDICSRVKKNFAELKPAYDFTITQYDAQSDKGHELIDKYDIRSSPGIVINNEFFTSGDTSKEDIIQRFEEIKNH